MKVTTTQAVMRSIVVSALKGHQRSQRLYTDLVGEQERKEKEDRDEAFVAFAKYKSVWGPEFARCKSLRMAEPDQLPHPDHVLLDPVTGEVAIAGPLTNEEKASWARWSKIRAAISKELEELRTWRDYPEFSSHPEIFLPAIAVAEDVLECIDLALGGSRSVMKTLEEMNYSEIKKAMQPSHRRCSARRQRISTLVHAALYERCKAEPSWEDWIQSSSALSRRTIRRN